MKLLLTSGGLTNPTIAQAFADLIGKAPQDSKVAFIPTAANAERGSKEWLIDDLYRIKSLGYYVDVIDIAVFDRDQLAQILPDFDTLFVGGGNTFYLNYWMERSGLGAMLPELLQTTVYAGISAGSMTVGAGMAFNSEIIDGVRQFTDPDYCEQGPLGQASERTLGLVDFSIRPHLNSPDFPLIRAETLQAKAGELQYPVYVLDDQSAVAVADGTVTVVSEGKWLLIQPQTTAD